MRSEVKLIKIAGVDIPKFDEPKGDLFEKAMKEITNKVEAKRLLIMGNTEERRKLKAELMRVNNLIIMEDSEETISSLQTEKKAIQDKLENLIDYSNLNINVYAKKLINDPTIQKLKQEADTEVLEIITKTREYEKVLTDLYNAILKETRTFTVDMGSASGSSTRRTNVKYNNYENA